MSTRLVTVAALVLLFSACNGEKGQNERRLIVECDQAVVLNVVRQDFSRGLTGVRRAAELLAPGFLVEDPAQRERQMRNVLRRIRRPPRGIEELMVSPLTFVAAVGTDGKVIARDIEAARDRMRGFDMGHAAPVVRRALEEGEAGFELGELPSTTEGEPPSVTILFAAPARHEGRIVGAVAAGLPLWSLGQQLSRQLQLDNAEDLRQGALLWALVYRNGELHHHAGFPPDLKQLVPDAQARQQGLSASPGGYTGEVYQYGRWYGYGVLPIPRLGENVGIVMFRSDGRRPARHCRDDERAGGERGPREGRRPR